jgi:hypothetical protein
MRKKRVKFLNKVKNYEYVLTAIRNLCGSRTETMTSSSYWRTLKRAWKLNSINRKELLNVTNNDRLRWIRFDCKKFDFAERYL